MAGKPRDPTRDRPAIRSAAAFWRPLVLGLGWICVVVGIAGLFLPLVPGTLFLILAAACFTRSSPRFEAWLLNHPRLGPPVRRWRETRAIPRGAKAVAGVSLAASWALIAATATPDAVKIGTLALFVAVGAFIGTRPDA